MMKQNVKRRLRRRDRGSALLVSLMIMVGLSLLGLSFVAISETENAISVNERNKTQTAAMAEAGAKAVVEWFQDPVTMEARGLLPPNTDDTHFKIVRTVNAYKGYYRPAGSRLFDTPFGPLEQDMFYGNEQNADFRIVAGANTQSDAFLKTFNETLFYKDDPTARIVSIRIYGPPNVGGVLVNGFWVAGQRMGVATVAVTAEKTNTLGAVVSQSICRLVLAPFPLPGPSGAIQALGTVATNGAYEVHWGAIESEDTAQLEVKREQTSFPWFDAWDRPYIEYGLDSSAAYQANFDYQNYAAPFPRGYVVRPTTVDATKHAYMIVATKAPHRSPSPEPAWNVTPGNETWYGDVKFKHVTPPSYPISSGAGSPYAQYDNHNWLVEMMDRGVEDPWFQVRAAGSIKGKDTGAGPANVPQFYDYEIQGMAKAGDYAVKPLTAKNGSNYFQYQTFDNRPNYKEIRVPKFDYDFWKSAALAGRGQEGVYYLRYAGNGLFTNDLETQTFEAWIAEGPGFFFFDTENGMNPQNGGPGKLVPIDASPCGAKGVVYMNTRSLKTTSGPECKGTNGWYNQPGEPYRDIGYRRVNETSVGTQIQKNFTTDAAGNFVREKAYNGQWDYQDLPWSNGGSAKNGIFDVCMAQRPMLQESSGAVVNKWVPLPYFPNCVVGNNVSTPGCNCSEPFEPYLNLRYAGQKLSVTGGWLAPSDAASVYPKVTDTEKPTGTKVTCTTDAVASKAGQEKCSTNAWDKRGALAWIASDTNMQPIAVEGVVYNEGDYNSSGNTAYYGSVVVGGAVTPQGTQEIWYDACLAADCWPPKHIPFPRVMITSTQIQ